MQPGLTVIDADLAGDGAALRDLAVWCQRYAPLTAADPPDGIRIDSTGADHLQGGEAALLADLRDRLARHGFAARLAVADTPGAAWGLARYGPDPLMVTPPGGGAAALAPLADRGAAAAGRNLGRARPAWLRHHGAIGRHPARPAGAALRRGAAAPARLCARDGLRASGAGAPGQPHPSAPAFRRAAEHGGGFCHRHRPVEPRRLCGAGAARGGGRGASIWSSNGWTAPCS